MKELQEAPTTTTLQDVFDNTKPSKNHENTCYKLMVKCIEIKPDLVPKDLEPLLRSYCSKHELDYSDCAVEISLGLAGGLGAIVEATRKLRIDPWRVELPDIAMDIPDLSEMATVCFYLSEAAKSEGIGTFFFSTRDAGNLIGKSHETAAKRFRLLRKYGVLELSNATYFDEVKKARMASEFTFISGAKSIGLTQYQTQTHTHHHTQREIENTEAEAERGDVASDMVGGGDAAQLFNYKTPKVGNLGTADDMIAQSVEKPKTGVLGALPLQETIREPNPSKAQTPPPEPAPDEPDRYKPNPEGQRVCPICNRMPVEHTETEIEDCWAKQTGGFKTNKPKTKAEQLEDKIQKELESCEAQGVDEFERTKRCAKLMTDAMGTRDTGSLNDVVSLIKQYDQANVAIEVCGVLQDKNVKTPIGALRWRLGKKHPQSAIA